MKAAMADWGRDGVGLWSEGNASLGQARTHSTPEGHLEALPRFDPDARIAFTARARLDNRDGLITELDLRTGIADGDIVQQQPIDAGASKRPCIYGDWAFAARNARDRRLFVARDHCGQTALYDCADDRVCAFASSRHAILALGLVLSGMDEHLPRPGVDIMECRQWRPHDPLVTQVTASGPPPDRRSTRRDALLLAYGGGPELRLPSRDDWSPPSSPCSTRS